MPRKNARRRKAIAKRKARAAATRNQRASRENGGSDQHWLTLVSSKTCCATCARILKPDTEMVYRHRPLEALCLLCADTAGIKARPSIRWERSRKSKVRRGPTWMWD
jgi:hypothetical protein